MAQEGGRGGGGGGGRRSGTEGRERHGEEGVAQEGENWRELHEREEIGRREWHKREGMNGGVVAQEERHGNGTSGREWGCGGWGGKDGWTSV